MVKKSTTFVLRLKKGEKPTELSKEKYSAAITSAKKYLPKK
jgi:hypothetical protein